MFSCGHFPKGHFNEHFQPITGDVYEPPGGGGGGNTSWVVVDQGMLAKFDLDRDDQEVLEFIVAFVLSR